MKLLKNTKMKTTEKLEEQLVTQGEKLKNAIKEKGEEMKEKYKN